MTICMMIQVAIAAFIGSMVGGAVADYIYKKQLMLKEKAKFLKEVRSRNEQGKNS